MFEIASFGAESPAAKQEKKLAQGKAPKAKSPKNKAEAHIARQKSLIVDLVKTAQICKKNGIDLSNPSIRAALIAAGGSATALAARIGPTKTLKCIQHFTLLAKKHGRYIRHLERNYREMRMFARNLERALGAPMDKPTKKAVEQSAKVGAWGLVLALAAVGTGAFFVLRQFSREQENGEVDKTRDEPAKEPTKIKVKLKDAASKTWIPAEKSMKATDSGITLIYEGDFKGKPFRVETKEGHQPVWSGLAWKVMPNELVAKIAIPAPSKPKVAGFRSGDIHGKDMQGIESCGAGLEEIVGADPTAARRQLMKSLVNWHKAEHNMGSIDYSQVAPAMTVPPGTLAKYRGVRTQMPMDRAFNALVTDRRMPIVWPGSRGGYSYNP